MTTLRDRDRMKKSGWQELQAEMRGDQTSHKSKETDIPMESSKRRTKGDITTKILLVLEKAPMYVITAQDLVDSPQKITSKDIKPLWRLDPQKEGSQEPSVRNRTKHSVEAREGLLCGLNSRTGKLSGRNVRYGIYLRKTTRFGIERSSTVRDENETLVDLARAARKALADQPLTAQECTVKGLGGFLNGAPVCALADSGADLIFIEQALAELLHYDLIYYPRHARPSFLMGHGRQVHAIAYLKVCNKFKRKFQKS